MSSSFSEFLVASLKSPLQTSTFFESSPRVGQQLARAVNLREDEIVVELGVGGGAVTEHLLGRLKERKQYVGFELNDDLYKFLNEDRFPELEIHHASAEDLKAKVGERKVGTVISTLPWSLIPPRARRNILDQIEDVLVPGGTFAVFTALHVMWTPAVRRFNKEIAQRYPQNSYVDELRNIPPCRLLFARKPLGPSKSKR